jgi:hypothetical protein
MTVIASLTEDHEISYKELEHFKDHDCRVFNNFHGRLPGNFDRSHSRWAIYTCLGEVLSFEHIQKIVNQLGSFVIIPTTRSYPNIPHKTDRYEIIAIPSAYAWYNQAMAAENFIVADKK